MNLFTMKQRWNIDTRPVKAMLEYYCESRPWRS